MNRTLGARAREFLSGLTTGMSRADAARWRTARTLDDLGDLVIAWLNGEVERTPGHCGPPDPETRPLIGVLTTVNRGGFVTDNSQLAESMDGRTWNTWVMGFASDEALARIREAAVGTPLAVRACRGKVHGCDRRWLHPCPRRETLAFWADACPDAADELRRTWWVEVEDPEPGRNDLLWPLLAKATGRETQEDIMAGYETRENATASDSARYPVKPLYRDWILRFAVDLLPPASRGPNELIQTAAPLVLWAAEAAGEDDLRARVMAMRQADSNDQDRRAAHKGPGEAPRRSPECFLAEARAYYAFIAGKTAEEAGL